MAPLRTTAVVLVVGLATTAGTVAAKPQIPPPVAEFRPAAQPPPVPDELSAAPPPASANSEPRRERPSNSKGDRPPKQQPLRDKPTPPVAPPDATPTAPNPEVLQAPSGAWTETRVPNFVVRNFRIPIFLLPIYQAAGIRYGIRWEILAAINEIETDYGRNLNVSSAGALGWMQFMPSSWHAYGVDANKDGVKDPYNPVDAIFAAARYLDAAGYEGDVKRAIFAYNHADWYVDSVLVRARLIASAPTDLIASLTGLTEGRFPVSARTHRIAPTDNRRSLEIFSAPGAPVVAVNDGIITKIGTSARLGRHLVLTDLYGNRYTYARLGSVAERYRGGSAPKLPAKALVKTSPHTTPAPRGPASAGRQPPKSPQGATRRKQRLFAHPSPPHLPEPKRGRLQPLHLGSRVLGGTTLGHLNGTVSEQGARLRLSIRPAGRGAPRIDPKPIVDGWKLLEASAIHGGRARLRPSASVGQVLLMPKPMLQRRVLADRRIAIYACGRQDIQAGQVDRRVLATLAFLAESGLNPTVTSLGCGHGFYTASGNISEHSSGNAVDIAKINGIPIIGHQQPGGPAEQTVRQLLRLQGTMRPHQIISLLQLGGPTVSMADHADHIHVGFQPQAVELLKAGQWSDLLARLRTIENPVIPTNRTGP